MIELPIPHDLMYLADWDALPDDNSTHYELQEGVLVVSPMSARRHRKAANRLSTQIDIQIPVEWETVVNFEVVVQAEDPATVRVPDLVVVRVDGPDNRVPASGELVAAEPFDIRIDIDALVAQRGA